jgi:hypothetical protein
MAATHQDDNHSCWHTHAVCSGGPAAAVPAALPLTAAIPAAWLAAPTLPAAAPAAAAASDPAPIATINDRRVRLPAPGVEEQDQVSLYRLCRQWVQNDPELAEAQEVRQPPASLAGCLPAFLPACPLLCSQEFAWHCAAEYTPLLLASK